MKKKILSLSWAISSIFYLNFALINIECNAASPALGSGVNALAGSSPAVGALSKSSVMSEAVSGIYNAITKKAAGEVKSVKKKGSKKIEQIKKALEVGKAIAANPYARTAAGTALVINAAGAIQRSLSNMATTKKIKKLEKQAMSNLSPRQTAKLLKKIDIEIYHIQNSTGMVPQKAIQHIDNLKQMKENILAYHNIEHSQNFHSNDNNKSRVFAYSKVKNFNSGVSGSVYRLDNQGVKQQITPTIQPEQQIRQPETTETMKPVVVAPARPLEPENQPRPINPAQHVGKH